MRICNRRIHSRQYIWFPASTAEAVYLAGCRRIRAGQIAPISWCDFPFFINFVRQGDGKLLDDIARHVIPGNGVDIPGAAVRATAKTIDLTGSRYDDTGVIGEWPGQDVFPVKKRIVTGNGGVNTAVAVVVPAITYFSCSGKTIRTTAKRVVVMILAAAGVCRKAVTITVLIYTAAGRRCRERVMVDQYGRIVRYGVGNIANTVFIDIRTCLGVPIRSGLLPVISSDAAAADDIGLLVTGEFFIEEERYTREVTCFITRYQRDGDILSAVVIKDIVIHPVILGIS